MAHHASNSAKPVRPQSNTPIRQAERFAHLPDEDQIKALITALNPASVPKHDQRAEVAEA